MERGCLGIICQFDRVKPLFSAGIQCRFQSCDSPLLCRVRSEKKVIKKINKRFSSGQLLSFIFEPLYQAILPVCAQEGLKALKDFSSKGYKMNGWPQKEEVGRNEMIVNEAERPKFKVF